jgi:hypothetical protein
LFVVLTHNRDSEILDESNWQSALDLLGGESDSVCIHRFNHWACGWWEALCAQEGTPEYQTALDIERRLGNYPILDESDYSEREHTAEMESWDSWGCKEFRDAIFKAWGRADDAGLREALDNVPAADLGKLYMDGADNPYESDGVSFPDIDKVAESLSIDDVCPKYIEAMKQECIHNALCFGDILGPGTKWFWDNQTKFELA